MYLYGAGSLTADSCSGGQETLLFSGINIFQSKVQHFSVFWRSRIQISALRPFILTDIYFNLQIFC
jgi:hypothetical protein